MVKQREKQQIHKTPPAFFGPARRIVPIWRWWAMDHRSHSNSRAVGSCWELWVWDLSRVFWRNSKAKGRRKKFAPWRFLLFETKKLWCIFPSLWSRDFLLSPLSHRNRPQNLGHQPLHPLRCRGMRWTCRTRRTGPSAWWPSNSLPRWSGRFGWVQWGKWNGWLAGWLVGWLGGWVVVVGWWLGVFFFDFGCDPRWWTF